MCSSDLAIVCLGDMPQVDADLIDRLIAAFDPDRGALVVVPTIEGKRGNPVVWSRRFFTDLMAVEGDVGARHLIGRYGEAVVEVPLSGKAALTDVDTPETLAAVRAELVLQVQEALNALDPLDREVVALRHFEQLSRVETAQVLGISEEAGAKRYIRALKRLKAVLAAMPGGLEGI